MAPMSARDKLYRDITDFLFISVMSDTSFDDMIDEDPERFEDFRLTFVNAVKNPYNDHLTALDHYLLGDVRYRRFFIQMQEDLDHVLETIPMEVTVPFADNFTLITCYLLDKLSNMVADCHCFCGSKGRFVD